MANTPPSRWYRLFGTSWPSRLCRHSCDQPTLNGLPRGYHALTEPAVAAARMPLREILNEIFYVLRGGVAWRLLPNDLPPRTTVYRWWPLPRPRASRGRSCGP